MLFFRLLARLPISILHRIASVLAFCLQYILRYRRAVILKNLRHSFPEKSPQVIRAIIRGFYGNLADVIVETIKLPGFSADQLRARVSITNIELVKPKIQSGQTIIVMTSHQANWEWIPATMALHGMPVDSVYKPLSSPFFEELCVRLELASGPFLCRWTHCPASW